MDKKNVTLKGKQQVFKWLPGVKRDISKQCSCPVDV